MVSRGVIYLILVLIFSLTKEAWVCCIQNT